MHDDDMKGRVFGHNAAEQLPGTTVADATHEPYVRRPVSIAEERLRRANTRSWWATPAAMVKWIRYVPERMRTLQAARAASLSGRRRGD